MAVLYRKYRPQKFATVVGQNHIKTTLAGEIISGHLAHAYLFVGPRGTGKTTLARLFARAINCLERPKDSAEPCNKCAICQQIMSGRSLDIIEIDAATHTQVDNVRANIIANAQVPPYNSKGYKVFVIDEVHMLSKAAFNALLKTMEEPPERVIFILATTEVRKVPETIISRCQRFDFKKIPTASIIERLQSIANQEQIIIPAEVLAAVARRSEGGMRDAESILGQIVGLAEDKKVTEEIAYLVLPRSNWNDVEIFLENLQVRNVQQALKHLHQLVREGIDVDDLAADLVEYTRQILLAQAMGLAYDPDIEQQRIAKIRELAGRFSTKELVNLLEVFLDKAAETKSAMIPQLPLELGIVEFCQDAVMAAEPIVERVVTEAPDSQTAAVMTTGSWNAILDAMKPLNHSLSAFMKVGHPISLEKGILTIGFEYDFHAERVRESKNKQTAQQIIGDVLGQPVTIQAIVDKDYQANHQKFNGGKDKEVEEVLGALGGGEMV
ncbi:MAG: DNA polymerase III subunit gamma/tau [Candidatus Komeilibacteria bacterium]